MCIVHGLEYHCQVVDDSMPMSESGNGVIGAEVGRVQGAPTNGSQMQRWQGLEASQG